MHASTNSVQMWCQRTDPGVIRKVVIRSFLTGVLTWIRRDAIPPKVNVAAHVVVRLPRRVVLCVRHRDKRAQRTTLRLSRVNRQASRAQ